jgi:2-dehydro-3-deoxyglucarate aldolase/4-hydroxy-2-oxoheptanedioate aldolase
MQENPVRAALQAGKTVFGCEQTALPVPEVARIYAAAGLDFVFIDLEHTSISLERASDLIRAARDASIVPIVRVPQAEYVWVARVLDSGALGIIVPRVNTAEETQQIVSWTRYPPEGIRGFASTLAQTRGENISAGDFIKHLHAHTLVVIQIERQQSVDNLESMLRVPGVDVACLGYMDLSVDLGIPGQVEHPRMVEAIHRIISVAERYHVAAGIIAPDFSTIARWVSAGMRFVSYSADHILLRQAAEQANTQLRQLARKEPC